MQAPLVLINALKLHEGPARILGGNFQHVLRLSEALARHRDWDIRFATDRVSHPVFAEKIASERLLPTGISGDSVPEADRAIAKLVRDLGPQLYHRPTGQLPFQRLLCRTVVSVADLNFRTLPTPFAKRVYKELSYWRTFKRADRITCVSDYTRREVQKHFGVPAERLCVIHHGTSQLTSPDFSLAESAGAPFWVTFGHQKHKNVETVLAALRRRLQDHPTCNEKLVVVGQSAHIDEVLRPLTASLGLEPAVLFAGRVNEANLHGLYQRTLGLVFLSRYEGFGLPLLEAMGSGCPVISSNACSLPEVGADAMLAFSPDDVSGVAQAMTRVATEPGLREDLAVRGRRRAGEFTWERAAKETLAVYCSVLGKS